LRQEATAHWYVEHLDFAINYQPANSRTVFIKAHDGSRIEIIEASGARRTPGMRDPGLCHLAIAVTDFAAAYARLRSQAVPFLTAPETVGGSTVAFFTDGDGNILHLLHRETPLP